MICTRSILPIPTEGEIVLEAFSWLFIYIILAVACSAISVRKLTNSNIFFRRLIYIIASASIVTACMFSYQCYTWHGSIKNYLQHHVKWFGSE